MSFWPSPLFKPTCTRRRCWVLCIQLSANTPSFEHYKLSATGVPPSRLASLARFAGTAKVTAIDRLPPIRRLATLVAFIHCLEATAQDDVIEVLDMFRIPVQVGHRFRWNPATLFQGVATRDNGWYLDSFLFKRRSRCRRRDYPCARYMRC